MCVYHQSDQGLISIYDETLEKLGIERNIPQQSHTQQTPNQHVKD